MRRLLPDGGLLRRRAAGETLRSLAADYGVVHTTLGRYFARPEVAKQLKAARRTGRAERAAERRANAARQAEERRLEREVRREAQRQAALERERSRRSIRALLQAAQRRGARSNARPQSPEPTHERSSVAFCGKRVSRADSAVAMLDRW